MDCIYRKDAGDYKKREDIVMREIDYESFCSQLASEVNGIFPDGYSAGIKEVLKNNGHMVSEISLSTPDSKVSPAIPLDKYYEEYLANDDLTMVDLASEVAATAFEAYENMPDWGMDVTSLLEPETAKSRIVAELINAHQNERLLEQVPHKLINEDLAEVFRIMVREDASVLIRNEHMPLLQMDIADLDDASKHNSISRYEFTDMAFMFPEGMMPEGMMYVGMSRSQETNEIMSFGASCITDVAFMDEVANRLGDDFAIIPSSIGEVIFINVEDGMDPNQVAAMIRDVNTAELRPEEVLSDKAYMYDYDHSRIITMEEGLQMRDLRKQQEQEQEMNRNVADPSIGIA